MLSSQLEREANRIENEHLKDGQVIDEQGNVTRAGPETSLEEARYASSDGLPNVQGCAQSVVCGMSELT